MATPAVRGASRREGIAELFDLLTLSHRVFESFKCDGLQSTATQK